MVMPLRGWCEVVWLLSRDPVAMRQSVTDSTRPNGGIPQGAAEDINHDEDR